MIVTEIKKYLYKHKPEALLYHKNEDHLFYECNIPNELIVFRVPVSEGINFKEKEPAQLLIRWLMVSSESDL